ncbi:plant/protein [Perilla frutescens var. hirtella]|uniref:Plant/protein n=1 Tax=Perilla frutescens var. hirtella TaxID=608512 RepID=A0AAD4JNN2_PERFH|nr:plant/protein [Perilla frutescens var. hirtella]
MVDDMAEKGKLKNCLMIRDDSRSMSGILMEVAVALGILLSELSEESWKGKIITFIEDPQLQIIEGEILKEKTEFVTKMDWGIFRRSLI